MMAYQESFLEYADGTKIRYRINNHKHEKMILFLHGLEESLEDYDFLFSYFDYNEISFNALELRGHGKSGYKKDVDFISYLTDIKRFAFGNLKNSPMYLMGHNLGALNAVALALDKRFYIKGIILIAPTLNIRLSKALKYFIYLISFFFPDLKYNFKQYDIIQEKQFSESSVFNKYLVIREIDIHSNKLIKNIKNIEKIPILLFFDKNSCILDNDLTIKQLQTIYNKTDLLKIIWYNEDRHLFKSKDKIEYLELITNWIKKLESQDKK